MKPHRQSERLSCGETALLPRFRAARNLLNRQAAAIRQRRRPSFPQVRDPVELNRRRPRLAEDAGEPCPERSACTRRVVLDKAS
jgi:hypothetical protein